MKLFKNIFVALAVIILAAGVAGASIMIVRNMEGDKSSQPASTSTKTSSSSSSSSSSTSSSITPPTSSTSSSSSSSSSNSSSSQSSSSSEPVPYIDEPGVLSTATSDASFRFFEEDSQQWLSFNSIHVPYHYSLDSEDSSKIVFENVSTTRVVRCDHPVSITTSYRYFCIDYSSYANVPDSTIMLSDTAIIRFEVTTNKTFGNVSLKGCFIDFKVNLNAYGWTTRNIIFDLENDGQCSFVGSSGPSTVSDQVSINFGNQSYAPEQWNTFLISNNINLSLMDCIAMSDIYSTILHPEVKQTFNVDGLYFSNETIE